jgi:hypothetical protein
MNIKKHHAEHLDGTKGSWRPALHAKAIGADGEHPDEFHELVVFSCPKCGMQQGVGADEPPAPQIVNGVTDKPVKCHNDPKICGWVSEQPLTFEDHQTEKGRKHFQELHDKAHQEVTEARERKIKKIIQDQIRDTIIEKSHEGMRAILPEGIERSQHQEIFKKFMTNRKPRA